MSEVVALRCRIAECKNIAKAVILTESNSEFELVAIPVCTDHAPEAAHETASSMDASEFLIVELPAFGVGGLR